MRRHALGWLRRWLKGEGDGRPCDEPLFTELPEKECLCFPENDRPVSVPSISEYIRPIAGRLIQGHPEGVTLSTPEDKRSQLEELLHIPDAYSDCMISEERLIVEDTFEARKLFLEAEPGIPLPLAIISRLGAQCREAVLVVHPEGKQVALGKISLPDMMDDDRMIVLADLRGTGETCWDNEPVHGISLHDAARAALWMGRTVTGDWISDMEAITEYLKEECGVETVSLLAFGEAGIAALGASVLNDSFASVEVRGMLASYLREEEDIAQSMSVHIPGILKWGDVSMLAALSQASVLIADPVDWAGKAYDGARIQAFKADIEHLASLMGLSARVFVTKS
ncbi:MAG: hypothetical protein PHT33_14625 [bacterium]|nr:hypothetical protein [bacterium]